jgi:hypothetical protein
MRHQRRTSHQVAPALWTAIGAIVVLVVAAPAVAQQPTQEQGNAIRQSCRSDYRSHCADVPTGGSAALACLQQNASSLSAPCQRALAAIGGGSAQATTPANEANPQASSPAPSTALPSRAPYPPMTPREKIAVMRVDCGRDYRMFCSGVPFGGGRAVACLKANAPRLSPRCQSALLEMKQAR